MANHKTDNRKEQIKNDLYDEGTKQITELGIELIQWLAAQCKQASINGFNSIKKSLESKEENQVKDKIITPEEELERLRQQLIEREEVMKLGEERFKNKIFFSMLQLGFSRNTIKSIINLADEEISVEGAKNAMANEDEKLIALLKDASASQIEPIASLSKKFLSGELDKEGLVREIRNEASRRRKLKLPGLEEEIYRPIFDLL